MPLTLERRIGEKILIGDDIVIEIADVKLRTGRHPRVSVRITAPPSVRIDREEVREQQQPLTTAATCRACNGQGERRDNRNALIPCEQCSGWGSRELTQAELEIDEAERREAAAFFGKVI